MLTLTIDNPSVENIFRKGFNANKEKFLEFIQESYRSVRNSKMSDVSTPNQDQNNWNRFIETTYGSLKDTPIKRGSQGTYEQRDSFV